MGSPRAGIACGSLSFLSLAACWSAPPELHVEQDIVAASGVAADLVFHSEGAPPKDALAAEQHLSLAVALQRAVTGDPRIQQALARVRVALADADQARTLPNPILGFLTRWGNGRPEIEASLTASVVQVLQMPRMVRQADHELRAAAADALTTALDVIAELQERYAQAQTADHTVPVLEQRLGLVERMLEVASSRQRNGEGTAADVAVFAARRIEVEVEVATARQQQKDQRLQLAQRVGDPASALDWTLDPWTTPNITAAPESTWIDAALRHRPELHAVGWRLAALGEQRAAAGWLPWLSSQTGVEVQRPADWVVGPTFSLPLPVFDRGAPVRDRIDAERAIALHELEGRLRTIVEEVRRAYAALATTQANLQRVRQALIPLQEQRRDQATTAFGQGQSDVVRVLLAEQDLRTARIQLLTLERDASIARFRLLRAVGGANATPGNAPEQSTQEQQK